MTRQKNTLRARVLAYYMERAARGEPPILRRRAAEALGLTYQQLAGVVSTFEPAEAELCGVRRRPQAVLRRATPPLPFGKPLPTLREQERALEAMLAPLGRLPSGRRIRG